VRRIAGSVRSIVTHRSARSEESHLLFLKTQVRFEATCTTRTLLDVRGGGERANSEGSHEGLSPELSCHSHTLRTSPMSFSGSLTTSLESFLVSTQEGGGVERLFGMQSSSSAASVGPGDVRF
jgi:hypothetical protein